MEDFPCILLIWNWIFFLLSKIAIRAWISEDKLKINDDKTEFLLVDTKQQLAKVCITDVQVGYVKISPSSSVRNPGILFDANLNVSEHN